MGRMDGKVVVITGAARGMGRCHALTFAREGADLVLSDIGQDIDLVPYAMGTTEELKSVEEEIKAMGRRVISTRCDVTVPSEVNGMVEAGIKEFGHLDILINNAGISGVGICPAWELTEEQWETKISVNLTSVWRVSKAVIPHMIKQNYGRIINISSIAGIQGIGLSSHYAAAKHGVIGLTRTMAIEAAPYNITVNAIAPGSVDTPMMELFGKAAGMTREEMIKIYSGAHLIPRLVTAQAISEACLYLASDGAEFVTGSTLPVEAGWVQKSGSAI